MGKDRPTTKTMTDGEIDANFKKVFEWLKKIERAQSTFSTDLEKDRGDLHDFTVEVARLGGIVNSLQKGQKNIAEKVGDATEEAIEPVRKEIKTLNQNIKEKKAILFKRSGRFLFWKWGE